tara:strand:+ start:148 stop:372 length:225 start_codon:yes stop_codon:yes gene_type:complete
MNAYDITFQMRCFGLDRDDAFRALQDAVYDNPDIVFTSVTKCKEVNTRTSQEEMTIMIEHAIEEVVLSLPDIEA